MVEQHVLAQVHAQRQAGINENEIKRILRIQGFTDIEIADAMSLSPTSVVAPAAQPTAPVQNPVSLVMPHNDAGSHVLNVMPTAPARVVQETAPEPMPMASPVSAVEAAQITETVTPRSGRLGTILLTVFMTLLLAAGGMGTVYAYTQKIGPFAPSLTGAYAEENLLSGILAKGSEMKSNTYSVSGSLKMAPREQDAVPFVLQLSDAEENQQKYLNDVQRAQDISAIISALSLARRTSVYPASLSSLKLTSYGAPVRATDPSTTAYYSYFATDGGTRYKLSVTFETDAAMAAIKKYQRFGSVSEGVTISGKTVTYDTAQYNSIYLPSEPPKPYLMMLGEYARFLPADIALSLSAAASADWSKEGSEWKFNVDATGDFGDLSYKINADALKKDAVYYLRINNIPGIFGGIFTDLKGTWIKIDPAKIDEHAGSLGRYSSYGESIAKAEERYKEDRGASVAYIKKLAAIADDVHLFKFRNTPRIEQVGTRELYRYDIRINKSAVVEFYKQAAEAATSSSYRAADRLFNDPAMIEYLQSPEFDQVFDYLDKNAKITLWTDKEGFPAQIEYAMRLVPPDTATKLASKQAMLVFTLAFSDINKPVDVEAPAESKDFTELAESAQLNDSYSLDGTRTNSRDARRVADIKQLQLGLELYYDANGAYPSDLSSLSGPGYIAQIPTDPSTRKGYSYVPTGTAGSCKGYHLGAVLESANSALSRDSDAAPAASCLRSVKDFNGLSTKCAAAAVSSSQDRCYDVTP